MRISCPLRFALSSTCRRAASQISGTSCHSSIKCGSFPINTNAGSVRAAAKVAASSKRSALFARQSAVHVLPHHFGPTISTAPNACNNLSSLPSTTRGRYPTGASPASDALVAFMSITRPIQVSNSAFPILRHTHSRFYAMPIPDFTPSLPPATGDRMPAIGRQAVDDRSASAAAVHRRRPRNANFPADPLQFRRPIWKIRVPWMAGHRWLDTRQDAQLDASDGSDSSVGPVGPDEDNGNRTTAQRRSTADGP